MRSSFQNRAIGKEEPTATTTTTNVLTPNRETKVVIVGAGLAGLSAAQRLHSLGFRDVIVLDALDRIGGRVHTINHSDYLLELGAQWLHGADENPLYHWLSEKNMLDDFEDASLSFEGLFCTNNGKQIDPKLVVKVINILVESKISLSKDLNAKVDGAKSASQIFSQWLEDACDHDDELNRNRFLVRDIFEWFLRYEAVENGCSSMDEVSVSSYTDWTDWGEGTLLNFKRGYGSLLDWFCSQIPTKQWIHLNTQVLNIEMLNESSNSCLLDSNDSTKQYSRPILVHYKSTAIIEDEPLPTMKQQPVIAGLIECDHVIVTASLGFLKNNQDTFFRPPLPRIKRDLIKSIGFGTVNKIVLQFDKPFWNNDHGIKLVWDRGDEKTSSFSSDNNNNNNNNEFPNWVRDIISFDIVRKQPNLLIGWIAGQGAQEMESETNNDVAEICLRLFDRFLPEGYSKPTRLIGCFCSRWNSNPFTCGSYSFQSMNSFDQNVEKLHEPLYNNYHQQASSHMGENNNNKLTTSSVSRIPRVLFAGEATAGKLYSTTHGAIITGWREADRIVDSISGSKNNKNIQQSSINMQQKISGTRNMMQMNTNSY